jgi:hypothetical protein
MGKGAGLKLPPLALGLPVTAQLQAGGGDGACFAGTFAGARKRSATKFLASGE